MKNTHIAQYLDRFCVKSHSILLIIVMLFFASCEDQLIEKPKAVVAENFYNTSEEVESAVNAIYATLRGNNIVEQTVILDTQTDWGYGRGSRADYNAMQGFNASNTINAGNRWHMFYLAIRNANLVIKNAPDGSAISEDDIDRNVAEAKFLRAFCIFSASQMLGKYSAKNGGEYD